MTILYPKTDDATFDMDYYTSTHMPMVAKAMGDGCMNWGAMSVSTEKHVAMGWIVIDSMETFNAGMAEHGAAIMADVANYTDIQPVMQTSEIVES